MKKLFPIIYARGNNGRVLTWQIEVSDNKYRTITGAEDAKLVTSEWTECEGKNKGRSNETSPEDQALLEADARFEKKLKSGGYWKNRRDIDKQKFIEPMLAQPLDGKFNKIKYPCMVDIKYNGCRMIITKDGAFSRKGEVFDTIPHILASLTDFFEQFPDAVLDGECYSDRYRQQLNELMSIVRKTKNITQEDLDKSREMVQFYCYDGYRFLDIEEESPCGDRRGAIHECFTLNDDSMVVPVPYIIAKDYNEIQSFYNDMVAEGHEGVIIRNVDAPYEHKRTWNLIKLKPTDDDEFKIIDIHEGTGNWAGAAKTATVQMKNGDTFDPTFKCEKHVAESILKNKKEWIGKVVTVSYNGFTGKGTPQFAQIDPQNCFKLDR